MSAIAAKVRSAPLGTRTQSWTRPGCAPVVGGTTRNHGREGRHQDPEVAGQRPAGDVLVVEADHLLEGAVGATVDLPGAGDAGAQLEPAQVPALFQRGGLAEDQRPRADPDHFAAQHVEELW